MSKIPQGEWNAIAARYQGGESISNIARSYGCTPPAIHYILKRNRQTPTAITEQQPVRPTPAAEPGLVRMTASSSAGAEPNSDNDPRIATIVDAPPEAAPGSASDTRSVPENGAKAAGFVRLESADRPDVSPARNFSNGAPRATLLRPAPPEPAKSAMFGAHPAGGTLAAPASQPSEGIAASKRLTPAAAGVQGLDDDLHRRAETAITVFRSSFEAALVESSADVRERLRQAANDLMRVAARTTMVLDRLNAMTDRSARTHNYPRSAHAGEDFKAR